MIRVFLDANVLFSAARPPGGVCRDIFRVAEKRGDVLLLATWYVIGEADIKLIYRGLSPISPPRVALQLLISRQVTRCSRPSIELNQRLGLLLSDPYDAPVLAGAVSAKADWLVTGNTKDFGHLYEETVEGVLILEPRAALNRLTQL